MRDARPGRFGARVREVTVAVVCAGMKKKNRYFDPFHRPFALLLFGGKELPMAALDYSRTQGIQQPLRRRAAAPLVLIGFCSLALIPAAAAMDL